MLKKSLIKTLFFKIYYYLFKITNIPFKRYLLALIISKIFLVCFWGLIGTGLIESFKHPINLVFIAIMVVLAYLITIIIKKVFKIDW